MESTLTTADFLALENRGYGYGHRDDYHRHSAASTTGIGLAAGLGGGALLLAIAGLWGLNKASEARNQGQTALAAANSAAIGAMYNSMQCERTARQNWEMKNTPTMQNYVDVQASPYVNAQAGALSSATSDAIALAALMNNGGINSAIGTDSFLKVQRYSAPQPCGCDSCGCNG